MGEREKTISMDEILKLYSSCGLAGNESSSPRRIINTGTLNRKLNTGAANKSEITANYSSKTFCTINDN